MKGKPRRQNIIRVIRHTKHCLTIRLTMITCASALQKEIYLVFTWTIRLSKCAKHPASGGKRPSSSSSDSSGSTIARA